MKIKNNVALILLAGATSLSAAQEDGRDAHESTIGALVAATSSPQHASALDPHRASTKPTFMTLPRDVLGIILQFLVGSTIKTPQATLDAMTMTLLSKEFNATVLSTDMQQIASLFVNRFVSFQLNRCNDYSRLAGNGSATVAEFFPNLTVLNLNGCRKIKDNGLAYLSPLSSLTCLSLRNTSITNAGLVRLSTFTNLSCLELSDNRFADAGLAHLSALTNLTHLVFYADRYTTNATLVHLSVHLSALTNLTTLKLHLCFNINDAVLPHLSRLSNLTNLTLGGARITDAGLVYIATFTNLAILDLKHCYITYAGVEMLRAANPNLEISI